MKRKSLARRAKYVDPPAVAQELHVQLRQSGHTVVEFKRCGSAWLFRMAQRLLSVRENDTFSSIQFLIRKEASTATAHLYAVFSVNVAVVAEEKEELVFFFCKRVDPNLVLQGLPFERRFIKSESSVQQTVHSFATHLEINANVRNQHQVTLTRFNRNSPRHCAPSGKRTLDWYVVLGGHRRWPVLTNGRIHCCHSRD